MWGGNMKFIDRKREMSTLEKEYNRENSFVVLYGRRRTGKTDVYKRQLNRSIQVEGAFAVLKEDMKLRKLKVRGKPRVLREIGLFLSLIHILFLLPFVMYGQEEEREELILQNLLLKQLKTTKKNICLLYTSVLHGI